MTIDQNERTVVTEEQPVAPVPAAQPVAPVPAAQPVAPVPAAQPVAPVPAAQPTTLVRETVRTDSRHMTRSGPGGTEMARRVIMLVFGLIQLVIGARIVLLLLDAREGNALVSGILDISQVFVAPFNGILNTNALKSGGSLLDVAAILALVGWTILELIVIWAIGIFRREPA